MYVPPAGAGVPTQRYLPNGGRSIRALLRDGDNPGEDIRLDQRETPHDDAGDQDHPRHPGLDRLAERVWVAIRVQQRHHERRDDARKRRPWRADAEVSRPLASRCGCSATKYSSVNGHGRDDDRAQAYRERIVVLPVHGVPPPWGGPTSRSPRSYRTQTVTALSVRLEMHPRTVQLQPHQPALGLRGVGGIHPDADAGKKSLSAPPATPHFDDRHLPQGESCLKAA